MAPWLTWLLVLIGGIAASLQAPINATLATHIRAIPASLISFLVGSATLLVITLFIMRGQGGLSGLSSGLSAAPLWSFLGGVCGAMVVTAVTLGTDAFGVNATLSFITAVQLFVALVIDTVGWGGRQPLPIHWPQVVGLVLIVVGVKLALTR